MKTAPKAAIIVFAISAIAVPAALWARGQQPAQPHLNAAMTSLKEGAHHLEEAGHDKGGHREKALQLTQQAIAEVQLGIAAGEEK
jgi:hypothetical protein